MIKIFLSGMGMLILFVNLAAMFKKPTIKDESAKGNSALLDLDRTNELWLEIGRFYQLLSMPIQWAIFSITLALSYFSIIDETGIYISMGLLVLVLSALLLSMKDIKRKLGSKGQGVEQVAKTLKLAVRSSISFPIVIYIICIGI